MKEWVFLIAVFGFLLAEEKRRQGITLRQGALKLLAKEGFDLIWQSAILILIYFFAVEIWIPKEMSKEFMFVVFFLLAYLLAAVWHRSGVFFLCVFSLCVSVPFMEMHAFPWIPILISVKAIVLIVIFELLMLGFQEKMLLFPIPKALEGLPISLLTASLLILFFVGLRFFPA